MKSYLFVALLSKGLKSSFELLCYLIVDGAKYSIFIVSFHQTQLFSNWMLSGFSSAGYHYYGDKPKRNLYKNSLWLLSINCFFLVVVFILFFYFFNIKVRVIAPLSAFFFSICVISAIYYRTHGLLIKSILILEFIPFIILLISVFIVSKTYSLNYEYLLVISFLIPAFYSIIKIFCVNHQKSEPFTFDIYKITLPFFIVSAFNMFLSKADTSVLFYFTKGVDINSYIISSRISGLILSLSYIFQHLFLPNIIKHLKLDLLDETEKYISMYMKYTFLFGTLFVLLFSFAHYLDFFNIIGLNVDFNLLLICCFFYLIITPLSIFTYLLIIKKHLISVLVFSSTGFCLTLSSIYIFRENLDNIVIALIFLSSTSVIKILEYIYYYYNYSSIKKI